MLLASSWERDVASIIIWSVLRLEMERIKKSREVCALLRLPLVITTDMSAASPHTVGALS